ncbi:MAG: class I SAM-dependent methyltransferase [Candidatus Sulfotelmatobacter sp.]
MMETQVASKSPQVKSWFENPNQYLQRRNFDIRIRLETVQGFTKGATFGRVLDIGCGDGSISLPLLPRSQKVTLLDVSSSMLAIARTNIPADRAEDVELINASFLSANLEPQSFDLILCIGVLAHVDSPEDFVAALSRIAKPGACIILEFTDSKHWWGIPDFVYRQILRLIRPDPYALNSLNNRYVMDLCRENNLVPDATYRYGLPPAGTHMVATQDDMYRLTRYLFGTWEQNRNTRMGNEFIYRLKKN